jgi:hypothetical protein
MIRAIVKDRLKKRRRMKGEKGLGSKGPYSIISPYVSSYSFL